MGVPPTRSHLILITFKCHEHMTLEIKFPTQEFWGHIQTVAGSKALRKTRGGVGSGDNYSPTQLASVSLCHATFFCWLSIRQL